MGHPLALSPGHLFPKNWGTHLDPFARRLARRFDVLPIKRLSRLIAVILVFEVSDGEKRER